MSLLRTKYRTRVLIVRCSNADNVGIRVGDGGGESDRVDSGGAALQPTPTWYFLAAVQVFTYTSLVPIMSGEYYLQPPLYEAS